MNICEHDGIEKENMTSFQDKVVLITGGASGIGKIMCRLCLERNAKVIIWDLNQSGIDQVIDEFSPMGKIFGYQLDVSITEQVRATARNVKDDIGTVDILINNAGIIVGKYFHEHTTDEILKTMEINAIAPMTIASEFLDDMVSQDYGHICNIASSGGLISNPKMSVYAASKWALIGWSDSVRLEMKKLKKNVNVTTIMPYYINTGMFDGVKSKLPILKPEEASLTIVQAIESERIMVTLPGYIYRFTRFFQAILPIRWFDWFADSVLGIYSTMEHFTGRKN